MNEADIELALTGRIEASSIALDWVYPNQSAEFIKPYGVVEVVRIARRDATMEGVNTISQGRVIVTVVSEIGRSTNASNAYADQIGALFPMGLRIPLTGGVIVVTKPADIREGFRESEDWRTPIIIDYEAS